MKDFANIVKPLNRLTEKEHPFDWTCNCQEAFDELKKKLCSSPVLAYPDPTKRFILDTDCSNVAMGAVLSQEHESGERVIAYFSKTLSRTEQNYCVTRKELLAVVKSMKNFHKYLYGQKFLLRTDHAALQWIMNFKEPEVQMARWLQYLQTYNFEIVHQKGKSHQNADSLSRRPCPEDCSHCGRQERKEVSTGQPVELMLRTGFSVVVHVMPVRGLIPEAELECKFTM